MTSPSLGRPPGLHVCALLLASGLAPGFGTAPLLAQSVEAASEPVEASAEPAGEAPGSPLADVPEVLVTARRREEGLQDVPLSVVAFSNAQLQAHGLNSDYDIANLTIGFRTLQQTGRDTDRPTIRGMSAPASRGEANASYFIDGVYVSGSISTAVTGAVERVEVLRGPQSAQFGRATFSGAVNYVTKEPTDTVQGELNGRTGTHDDYAISGWSSGPIGDSTFGYLISGSWSDYGGQWNNDLQPGEAGYDADFREPVNEFLLDPPQEGDSTALGAEETRDVLGKLVWRPSEGSEVSLKYGYTKSDDSHFPSLLATDLNCNIPTPENRDQVPWWNTTQADYCGKWTDGGRKNKINLPDISEGVVYILAPILPTEEDPRPEDYSISGTEPGTFREQNRILLQYVQDVRGYTVTTRGAWNKDEFRQLFDLDHTPTRAVWGLFHFDLNRDIEDTSFEIRLDSPADRPVRYGFGGYLYDQNRDAKQRSYVGPTVALSNFFGVNVTTDYPPSVHTDLTNTAVFGSLDVDLNDQWTVALEARYATDEKSLQGGALGTCDGSVCSPNDVKAEFSNTTPRATLRYQPTDDLTTYLLVAKGNKPGDFNAEFFRSGIAPAAVLAGLNGCTPSLPPLVIPCLSQPLAIVDEEEQWTYELGAKANWLDGRLTTNLAVYYIDWQNQGLFTTVNILQTTDTYLTTTIITNVGESEVKGVELETSFQVNDNLSLVANYGYTESTYVKGEDPSLLASTGNGNLHGNYVPGVPKNTLILGASLTGLVGADYTLFFAPDLILNSKRYTSASNLAWIDSETTVNLRTGIQSDRWTATAYVRNLTDDDTPVAVLDFFNFGSIGLENLKAEDLITRRGYLLNGRYPRLYGINPKRGRDWGIELQYRF